jgi:hypothetical protein
MDLTRKGQGGEPHSLGVGRLHLVPLGALFLHLYLLYRLIGCATSGLGQEQDQPGKRTMTTWAKHMAFRVHGATSSVSERFSLQITSGIQTAGRREHMEGWNERQLQPRSHPGPVSPLVPFQVAAEAWPDSTHSVPFPLGSVAAMERK